MKPIGLACALAMRPCSSRAVSASAARLFRLRAASIARRAVGSRLCASALAASSGQSRSSEGGAAHALSFAMIGVVRKDRCRSEQLLGQHRADEQVRPGRRAERQQQVSASRAARSSCPSAAPIRKRASRLPPSRQASSFLASSIEDSAFPRSSSTIGDAVAGKVGQLAAAVRQLGHLGRPVDALQIAVDQLGLRRAADLPARNDVEQHLLLVGGRAERPGEDRLEAVVDRARGLGDGARTVARRRA